MFIKLQKITFRVAQYVHIKSFATSAIKAANYECNIPTPELDIEYLCNLDNKKEIETNIRNRKGVGDINRVHEFYNQWQTEIKHGDQTKIRNCLQDFNNEAIRIPNKSCSVVETYGETPRKAKVLGDPISYEFQPKEFSDLTKDLGLLRNDNLGNLSGHKSYYLLGDLAEMEQALVEFTIQCLIRRNFQLISVPDILHSNVVESCGMNTKGERTQVYMLDPDHYGKDLCLSGTSEMALAGYLMNEVFQMNEMPRRLAAVSRCYRAETSSIAEEKGIYRVHQFTKVEMFGVTDQENSGKLTEEFLTIQEENFESLGLHFQTLDMPPHELGAPAYRKYDVEAWLPGRRMFGEISSCSDCTDYQSRRLNIKYKPNNSTTLVHAHTVNGTACAIPRMLIALLETHQQADGTVHIPKLLQPYMNGKTVIRKQNKVSVMTGLKGKNRDVKRIKK